MENFKDWWSNKQLEYVCLLFPEHIFELITTNSFTISLKHSLSVYKIHTSFSGYVIQTINLAAPDRSIWSKKEAQMWEMRLLRDEKKGSSSKQLKETTNQKNVEERNPQFSPKPNCSPQMNSQFITLSVTDILPAFLLKTNLFDWHFLPWMNYFSYSFIFCRDGWDGNEMNNLYLHTPLIEDESICNVRLAGSNYQTDVWW